MKKVDIGDTTFRNALLKIFTDAHTPATTILKYSEQMRGKTNEEKEQIAKRLISEIEAGKIDLT